MRQKVSKSTPVFLSEKIQWQKFYKKHFGLDVDFTNLVIPEKPLKGIWRLLIVNQLLTLDQCLSCSIKSF